MVRKEVLALLKTVAEDVEVTEDGDTITAMVKDFAGFDSHWNRLYRDYDVYAVGNVRDALWRGAVWVDEGHYIVFDMGDFYVKWGHTSFI